MFSSQENLSFLGSCGIVEIQGLNVAFLSGRFDPVTYKDKWGRRLSNGGKAAFFRHVAATSNPRVRELRTDIASGKLT